MLRNLALKTLTHLICGQSDLESRASYFWVHSTADHIMRYGIGAFPSRRRIKVLSCVDTSGGFPLTYDGAKNIYRPLTTLPTVRFFSTLFPTAPLLIGHSLQTTLYTPWALISSPHSVAGPDLVATPWILTILRSTTQVPLPPNYTWKHRSGHAGPYTCPRHFISCPSWGTDACLKFYSSAASSWTPKTLSSLLSSSPSWVSIEPGTE